MKIVLQRVSRASVIVDKVTLNSIEKGYMLLVSFTHSDTMEQVIKMAKKVSNLRVFEDENEKLNLSIKDVNGSILSISQFTLYGDASKGNRPSFVESMKFDEANKLYEAFNKELNEVHNIVTKGGSFGNHMEIDLVHDGPVTIILEM